MTLTQRAGKHYMKLEHVLELIKMKQKMEGNCCMSLPKKKYASSYKRIMLKEKSVQVKKMKTRKST